MRVRVPLAFGSPLVEAVFLRRPSQLVIEAQLEDKSVRAHMADQGHLLELFYPGARLLLAPRNEIGRKTAFQVVGVYVGDELVSLDVQLPNRLVTAALSAGALPQFARYTKFSSEVMVKSHRFDFRLGEGLMTCLLEVKSVEQVVNGLAIFPDAPTERGRHQLEALTTLVQKGQRAAMLFIVQRSRACALVPNEETDPLFARTLRQAIAAGVEVYAHLCPLTPDGITLGEGLPVFGSINTVNAPYQPAHWV
ncbi:MAG: DNA/RNA nuclease SfsA [Chloroflexales bacterium]|nr:DNA/RNA nuclease SfsA [Chloroflexales bacterium]